MIESGCGSSPVPVLSISHNMLLIPCIATTPSPASKAACFFVVLSLLECLCAVTSGMKLNGWGRGHL